VLICVFVLRRRGVRPLCYSGHAKGAFFADRATGGEECGHFITGVCDGGRRNGPVAQA
jgi:hypothetical protein